MSLDLLVEGEAIHNLLKEEDAPYVRAVVEHFKEYGLKRVYLEGSASGGKNYRDIDLKIKGNFKNIKRALAEFYTRRFEFEDHSRYMINWVKPPETSEYITYVGNCIDERHKLEVFRGEKPPLILDLNFIYDPFNRSVQGDFFYRLFGSINSTLKSILKKN